MPDAALFSSLAAQSLHRPIRAYHTATAVSPPPSSPSPFATGILSLFRMEVRTFPPCPSRVLPALRLPATERPGHFVTALQWRRNSPHLLAANSAGYVWLLGLQL